MKHARSTSGVGSASPFTSPVPVSLRSVRIRKGRCLALPTGASALLVPYRLEVLAQRSASFLLPLLRRPGATDDALLLDASGLLPLSRRFSTPSLRPALRRRDRTEAEAVLAGVDAALAAAADKLLPESGFDLSPGSVFLCYREDETVRAEAPSHTTEPVHPRSPDLFRARPFDVHLAFVPCRIEAETFPGREDLRRWFEARRLVARRPHPAVRLSPLPTAVHPARPARPSPQAAVHPARPPRPRRSAAAVLPWAVPLAETAAVAAAFWLESTGTFGIMPVLLGVLAVLDAGLLLHPASPLCLRHAGAGAGAAQSAPGQPSGRTEPLSTVGTVTKMGILSENEPGSFEEVEGRRWFVLVDEFTVGRDAERVDLVPDGPGVSRVHARIRRLGGSFTVEDCSTRNGTFLDDRRLDPGEERVLPERCTLRFAGAKFYFRVE